jgi:hypothetical protein
MVLATRHHSPTVNFLFRPHPPLWCFSRSIILVLLTLNLCALGAPSVTVTTPTPGSTISSLSSIAITFNEPVTGVDADDLAINGNAATFVTGSGAGPYNFTFTQPEPGTVTVDWVGDHGIAGLGGSGAFVPGLFWTYTLTDTVAPTILDRTPSAGSTVGVLTQVVIGFSEPVVGVDAGDLLINGNPATGLAGSGLGPYIFTFAQPAAGTVTFSWAAGHGIQDTAVPANNFAGGNWTTTLSATGIGSLVINEFLSSNGTGLVDENGEPEDWIELYNPGPNPVNLTGWALTVDDVDLGEWVFPAWSLNAGQYMIVYASGKDRKPSQTTAGVDNANTVASPRLHTNFTINETGGFLALTSPESPRTIVSGFNPFPEQRTDYSYGPQPAGGLRYFTPPTPKAANNASTLTAITPKVAFSVNRGFFKDPFQLVLSCSDSTATIRYTTNFTEPTAANGTIYTGPIAISATSNIRAVAFGTGKIPSFPVTHSYIYLDQVLSQPANPAGFPSNWGSNASFTGGVVPADYGMDTDPVRVDPNNAGSAIDPAKQQRLKDGLRELPIVSVTIPIIDMFGSNGLYYYPNVTNKSFGYKKCAVEMILPDGSSAFSVVCGISGHGNASRDPLKNPKHGFQLKFKGDFGESSLDYQLFPGSPVKNFDDIILRPDFNSSWRHWSDDATNGNGAFQRSRGTRIRDAWSKETFRTMGNIASNHRFTHLFINGLYWGTYDLAEQPVDGFAQELMGGAKADYAIVHEGQFRNGDDPVYTTMSNMPNITTNALYEQMKGYLDVTQFIDYTLLHFYIGHQDWGNVKNWYAIRRRATPANPAQGKYQYIPWDQECTLLDTTVNRVATTDLPSNLHPKLLLHPQYKLDFADRVHRHMIAPNGAMTAAANIARWQKWQGIIDKPIVAESARWGDYRRDVHQYQTGTYVIYTREGHFLPECTRLTGTYFPGRGATLLSQLQSAGLYPAVAAPQLRQTNAAGPIVGTSQVDAGYVLAMTNPSGSGTIYFTTDGNDPHIYYTPTTGATAASVAPTAVAYTTPITINSTTTIKARVLNASGTWTALNEATFTVGLSLPSIRITELMYNPPGGTAHEFLEIQNTGTTAVDLSGWYFEGIGFYFPIGSVLNAGGRLVLGNNDGKTGAFAAQYPGVTPFGWFSGSLDNSGERVALFDANGRLISSVTYDDVIPWTVAADGSGVSLEIIDPNGDPNDPLNWKGSNALKGTPGTPNSPPAAQSVVLNEVGVFGASFLEFYNSTASPVSIAGWEIRGVVTSTIPVGQVVPANGYYVLSLAMPASATKEGTIAIYTNTSLTTRVDGVSWGNQGSSWTIGRVAGNWTFCTPSPSAVNVAATLAPLANLAINEWLANPAPGGSDWVELYNKHATLPIALMGVNVQTTTQIHPIRALTLVPPQGWLQLFADELPGGNHLNLKLPAEGTTISLVDITNTTFDSITYGAQVQDVTSGRLPDGTGAITPFPGTASPGAANYIVTGYTGPVLNEVLARNVSSAMAPWGTNADWCELYNPGGAPVDLGGLRIGRSRDGTGAWFIPSGTIIPANGYLAFWCDETRAADLLTNADLNTGFSLGDFSDGLYLINASGQVVSFIEWGAQIVDRTIGVDAGTWKLLSTPTRGAANSAATTLGSVANLRINEWASALSTGDWLELYNLDSNPIALGGLYLTDDPGEVGRTKFQFALLSFLGGSASQSAWLQLLADGAPALGKNHVNFQLSADAEYLRLSNNDASFTAIDSVSFGLQALTATQGRIVDGQSIQVGLIPTPGAKNLMVPVINAHPQPLTVAANSPANFSATVVGSEPLTFQWRKNGIDVQNATANPFQIGAASESDDGLYDLVVTNTAGNVTSQSARLFVQLTFDQWRANRFTPGELADPNLSSAGADFDKDGLSNAQEYFQNLNPKFSDNGVGNIQIGREPATGQPTFLTLTYRQSARATGLAIQHQISDLLENGSWSNISPTVTETLALDPVTGDPVKRVKFSVAPSDTKKFLRLQLTP